MLRKKLIETLKAELKTGLQSALVEEASKYNPSGSVTLATLKAQAEHAADTLCTAQDALDNARRQLEKLTKMLDGANEISPAFLQRAVDAYIDRQVL